MTPSTIRLGLSQCDSGNCVPVEREGVYEREKAMMSENSGKGTSLRSINNTILPIEEMNEARVAMIHTQKEQKWYDHGVRLLKD